MRGWQEVSQRFTAASPRLAPDKREQVVAQDLEHHAHVAAVRPRVLKPVNHAAAVVGILCGSAWVG